MGTAALSKATNMTSSQYGPIETSSDPVADNDEPPRDGKIIILIVRVVQLLFLVVMVVLVVLVAFNARDDNQYRGSDSERENFHNISTHDSDAPDETLQLALLMSFPNSGTSYSLKLVRAVSNMSTASNYCDGSGYYAPIYGEETPGPHLIKEGREHDMPKKYILTKTHCGGRCGRCPPSKYIISARKFRKECLSECYNFPDKQTRKYSRSLVGKAVHLFRNPYDNVISRFHLRMHYVEKTNCTKELGRYSYTPEGFQKFCDDRDKLYAKKDQSWLGEDLVEAAKDVPCYSEFYKYVQWHNYAFETTTRLNVPTYILHYKDYHDDFNGTITNLLQFLEMPYVGKAESFFWRNYTEYYSDAQRNATNKFVGKLASPETWSELHRYGFV